MKKQFLVLALAFIVVLQGCSSKKDDTQTENVASGDAAVTATVAPALTQAVIPTTEAVPTQASSLVLPLTTNDTGKVMIQSVSSDHYNFNSYIITSSEGDSIVIDPCDMPDKSIVDINPVAIICTHGHPDHIDMDYTDAYEGLTLMHKEGEIKTKNFKIYSIKASHSGDVINGTNFINVIEVDGLRIAQCGDLGQSKLTEEQMEQLGAIDIAFMQFENNFSTMSAKNEKGFHLIEQINPKIFITTHCTPKCDTKIQEKYGSLNQVENILEISKEDLPDTYLNAYRIMNTHKYE
jgi:hypothetical protein